MSKEKQNREDLRRDVQEIFKQFEQLIFEKDGKLDHLFRSGVIDFSNPQEDYRLAKQIIMAIAMEMRTQYQPPGMSSRAISFTVDQLYSQL